MEADAQDKRGGGDERPSVIEYYYRVKWGYADEFVRLYRKNYLPALKKQIELGRILRVTMVTPRIRDTEYARWDYRVTITFRNAKVAASDFDSDSFNKKLYPDQVTFKREEKRRSDILLSHWALPVNEVDLESK